MRLCTEMHFRVPLNGYDPDRSIVRAIPTSTIVGFHPARASSCVHAVFGRRGDVTRNVRLAGTAHVSPQKLTETVNSEQIDINYLSLDAIFHLAATIGFSKAPKFFPFQTYGESFALHENLKLRLANYFCRVERNISIDERDTEMTSSPENRPLNTFAKQMTSRNFEKPPPARLSKTADAVST